MKRIVRVESYWSFSTDLASEFRSWPEFVTGAGYNVELSSAVGERVFVRYSETEDSPILTIEGIGESDLFDRVLGRAIYALAAHSDTVCIHRYAPDA